MAVVELSRSLRHWRHRVRARSGRSLEALVHHRGGPATLQPDPARHPPDVCARLAGVTARAGYRDRPAQGLPPAPRGLARLLGLGAAGLSVAAGALRARASACESGGEERGRAGEQGDADEDDDFDFEFAKPPVAQVDLGLQVSVQLSAGADGARPVADISVSSSFSLPVERGWPRDTLSPSDVAGHMSEALADRLPRWVADACGLELLGAPPQLRGLGGWRAGETMAQLRPRWLPEPLPPLLTARLRARRAGEPCVFSLGGVLCAGADAAELRVSCAPAGLCLEPGGAERLDLRLTTELRGVPAAGRLWGLVGCGGRWWFQKVRLPVVRGALQEFHEMVHEQMTLFYVAALAG